MHLKTVKLNSLTLGELQNEPISKKKKKVEYPFKVQKPKEQKEYEIFHKINFIYWMCLCLLLLYVKVLC